MRSQVGRFASWQEERPTAAPVASQKKDEDDNVPKLGASTLDLTAPITIPPLKTPNIGIEGIGSGLTPKDVIQGRLPPPIPMPSGAEREYGMYSINKQFEPSAICHKPLYFQDTMLERHGHQRFPCAQPVVSGVRFFGTLPLMPYMMTLHPPGEDMYNLGHYRPGSAAPCLRERMPYDQRALRNQVLTTAGVLVAAPL